jgi:hypothetical protein
MHVSPIIRRQVQQTNLQSAERVLTAGWPSKISGPLSLELPMRRPYDEGY